IPARRVVAGGHRRPRPDEDAARIAHATCLRLSSAEQHEMLGRDRLRLLEGRDRGADRVVTVFPLCGQLELDNTRIAVTRDDDFGGAAGKVDRDVARDLELRLVHVLVAGPDDLVDALDVREKTDRLRAAEGPHLVDAEHLRRGGDRGCTLRGRAYDD